MTDRDHFAAAALAGLLGGRLGPHKGSENASYATLAYSLADAMLRERDNHLEKPNSSTNHDAAPAARANAESVAPQPTAGDRSGNPTSHSGTGKQPAPPCVETDGFSSGSRSGQINRTPERESPRRECGESSLRDVPQPDNGRAAGGPEHHISEAENANEPVAWAVMERDGFGIEGTFTDRDEAAEWCDSRQEIVPLYRSPTLTDEERLRDARYPAQWTQEVAAVEAAFERSGVNPTWPDDEVGNIGPMAEAMADEVERLRGNSSVGVSATGAESGSTPDAQGFGRSKDSPCQPFDSAPTTDQERFVRFQSAVMNWISEATGFLHDDVLRTDDARDVITNACSRCWDAFDRIAYQSTNHDAAPAARASLPTADHAVRRGCESGCGTGNTHDSPKPINADRLAALEELSALDQELELEHGIKGNPMIKARHNNESI